jgi:hypothetical protein
MEFYIKNTKLLLVVFFLLAFFSHVSIAEKSKEDSEFESAMRKVLSHGNLMDTDYLSKSIGLTVLIPSKIEAFQSYGIIYSYPYFFSSTNASYFIRADENGRVNRVNIRFVPNKCQSLYEWGRKWNRKVDVDMLLHAAGSSEKIIWGGKNSVSVSRISYSTGGCEINLSQIFKDPAPLSSSAEIPQISIKHVVNKIGELLLVRDFRDQDKVSEIIRHQSAEYPSLLPVNFLAKKANSNINPNPWVAQGMYLSVNDSGWDSDHIWVWTPKHITERFVRFNLPIDTRQVCVTQQDLTAELIKRNISYDDIHNGSLSFVFTGDHQIMINILFKAGCVSGMDVRQVTDFLNAITRPTVFPVSDSLNKGENKLSDGAKIQLEKLIASISGEQVFKINIYKNYSSSISDSDKQKVEKIINLIKIAFLERGFDSETISILSNVDTTLSYKWKDQLNKSAVLVDPLVR